ncbi:hypothetical protein D3C76_324230 [compost metagenome]
MKYWALMVLMAVSGSVFADNTKTTEVPTESSDIEVRAYAGVGFSNTTFAVVHDRRTRVTCYVTESDNSGTSPVQTCFSDQDINN